MRITLCPGAAAILVLLFLPASASACSCGGGGEPCQAYGSAAAVFVGTVTGVRDLPPLERDEARRREDAGEYSWGRRVYKFSVEQTFLGTTGPEAEVGTGTGSGDCGYSFKQGERYLVYAYHYSRDRRLKTSTCTRTKPYAASEKDLEYLRGLPARAPGVTVEGTVYHQLRSAYHGNFRGVSRLADAALIIEGEGAREELHTDAEGRYRLTGLRPGRYKVSLKLPDELTAFQPEQEVSVADRGCATVDYYVTDNGRVSGRVFDAAGTPVARVQLALVAADSPEAERPASDKHHSISSRTDDEGRYSFSAVPAGNYLLVVNLNRFPEYGDSSNAYPRTFYPGVALAREAEVISVREGESVSGRDLRLPSPRAESVVHGVVAWEDGSPVAHAGVSFRDITYHDPQMNYSVNADEHGRFDLKGYVGQTFVIEVRSNRPSVGDPRRPEPAERAEPLRITLAGPIERARLVIQRHW